MTNSADDLQLDATGLQQHESGETNMAKMPAAVFGEDMGLFISNLYNFYQSADFQVKKQFLKLVETYILRFEKELLVSLSAFVLFIIPALDDQNEKQVTKIH